MKYSAITPVISDLPAQYQSFSEYFREVSERGILHPDSSLRHYAASTIAKWYELYVKNGFDSLQPSGRCDEGKPRKLDDALQEQILYLKEHYPRMSAAAIYKQLQHNGSIRRGELSESTIRDGSTGEITQGYLAIDAAVLSKKGKMPLPVYERVFSAAEKGFISETYENLRCLESLSKNFTPKCVRTLDRGFDTNDYYRYFLKRGERFIIREKKTRNVIYNGKTCNIMDVALRYKGAYRMDFKDKRGRSVQWKMSCIPVRLYKFPAKELVLTVVYGFGEEPMLLLSNLKMQEKKIVPHHYQSVSAAMAGRGIFPVQETAVIKTVFFLQN